MKSRKRLIHDARSARIISGISEQTLDTTEDLSIKTAGVSRRDFMRISSQFGVTSTLGAAAMTARSARNKFHRESNATLCRGGFLFAGRRGLRWLIP